MTCGRRPTPNPDWFAFVRLGDVLQEGRFGSYRVAREVSRHRDGALRSITCTIRHRSWTRACYTVLTASDLKVRGFRYVGVRVKLDSPLDARIANAIRHHQRPGHPPANQATFADVQGVA